MKALFILALLSLSAVSFAEGMVDAVDCEASSEEFVSMDAKSGAATDEIKSKDNSSTIE